MSQTLRDEGYSEWFWWVWFNAVALENKTYPLTGDMRGKTSWEKVSEHLPHHGTHASESRTPGG